jgi:hypothetical protein
VEVLTKAMVKDLEEIKVKDLEEIKVKDLEEIKVKDSVEIKDLEVTKGLVAMEGKDLIITLIQIIIMYQILPNLNQVFQQILIHRTLIKVLPIFTKDQHTIIQLKYLKTLN